MYFIHFFKFKEIRPIGNIRHEPLRNGAIKKGQVDITECQLHPKRHSEKDIWQGQSNGNQLVSARTKPFSRSNTGPLTSQATSSRDRRKPRHYCRRPIRRQSSHRFAEIWPGSDTGSEPKSATRVCYLIPSSTSNNVAPMTKSGVACLSRLFVLNFSRVFQFH
jgi:hypothetical protein